MHKTEKCEFARPEVPGRSLGLSLFCIWDVDADGSYDVERDYQKNDRAMILIRTISGCGLIEMKDGRKHTLDGGTLLLVNYCGMRRTSTIGDGWHFVWLEFVCGDILPIAKDTVMDLSVLPDEYLEFSSVLNKLRRESESKRNVAAAVFTRMIYSWVASLSEEKFLTSYHKEIEHVIELMHRNITSSSSIAELGRSVNIGERRFRQLFRLETGTSPKLFYEKIKIHAAAELLKCGMSNVAETAERFGFSSAYHFSRAFKKICGYPPSSIKPVWHRRTP